MRKGKVEICAALFALALAAGAIRDVRAAAEDEPVSLLQEYLRINTTNPPGNEIAAAEFLKKVLASEGIEARIFQSEPGRASIYARLKGDGTRKGVLLLNHLDVVPADARYWSVDPFSASIKDSYLWGRGAVDMKGMAIVELEAFLGLKRKGVRLKGDVVFLGVADEEAGGAVGAGYVTREHPEVYEGVGSVINEFGGIFTDDDGKPQVYDINVTEKVPLWLKLTAVGKPGHGSQPRPDTAVNRLLEALRRVSAMDLPVKVEPIVQQVYAQTARFEKDPKSRSKFENLQASLRDPQFAGEFTKDASANASVRNTIAITMLEGSPKINVIPPEASAQLDIRLLPSENPKEFLQGLKKAIADDTIHIDTIFTFEPNSSPPNGPLVDVVRKLAKEHHPGAVVTADLLNGFTDCHYFREKGIDCYGFMPFVLRGAELGGIHGNDERISLENIRFGTGFMFDLLKGIVAN